MAVPAAAPGLSGTCSGMDSTVWMKAQVLVYVFGIYLHASVYVLYVHVCVCMKMELWWTERTGASAVPLRDGAPRSGRRGRRGIPSGWRRCQ